MNVSFSAHFIVFIKFVGREVKKNDPQSFLYESSDL